jgi:hypothetical protein
MGSLKNFGSWPCILAKACSLFALLLCPVLDCAFEGHARSRDVHIPNSQVQNPTRLPNSRRESAIPLSHVASTNPAPTGSLTPVNTVGTLRLTCRNGRGCLADRNPSARQFFLSMSFCTFLPISIKRRQTFSRNDITLSTSASLGSLSSGSPGLAPDGLGAPGKGSPRPNSSFFRVAFSLCRRAISVSSGERSSGTTSQTHPPSLRPHARRTELKETETLLCITDSGSASPRSRFPPSEPNWLHWGHGRLRQKAGDGSECRRNPCRAHVFSRRSPQPNSPRMFTTRAPEAPPWVGLGRGSRVGQRFSRRALAMVFARNIPRHDLDRTISVAWGIGACREALP